MFFPHYPLRYIFSVIGFNDLTDNNTLVKTLCGKHEMKSILSLDNNLVLELQAHGGLLPSDLYFKATYYERKKICNIIRKKNGIQ